MIVSYTEGSYRINYSSSKVSDDKISSNVRMFKEPSNNNKRENQKIVSSFNLDKADKESYRLSTHKDVLKEANRLGISTDFSISTWEEVTSVYESFLLSFKQNENSLFFSELGQNTTFHFSSFNIIKRSLESKTECKCTPSPFYFTSTTPFMCQEDLSYDVSEIKTRLNENREFINSRYNQEDVKTLENILNSISDDILSFEQLYIGIHGTSFSNDDLDDVPNGWWLTWTRVCPRVLW
jgi:hypothetical protein